MRERGSSRVARREQARRTWWQKIAAWPDMLRQEWRTHTPETAFLLLGASFGLLFVFLVPPTQAADETTHFYRAYQLSEGKIFSDTVEEHGVGAELPREVYTVSRQLFADIPSHYERLFNYGQIPPLLADRMDTSDRMMVHIEGASVYSPAGYLPQVAAISVAKIVWPSVTLMYYLGRLANLAVWLVLMYAAMRLWPGNKWALFALALMPMTISQGAIFSPDATINSLAFFAAAGALYLRSRGKALTWKHVALAFAVVIMLSLCKPVLFVFGFLALLIPARLLGGRRNYWLFASGLVLAGLLITAIWNAQVKDYGAAINYYYYPNVDIDQGRQLTSMLTEPAQFLFALGQAHLSSVADLVTTTFVGRLGWWDVDMPIWLVAGIYGMIALAVLARDKRDYQFDRWARVLPAFIWAAGFLAINAVLYITITQVGVNYITGLQGRYFIAIAPLLVPLFAGLLVVQDWRRIAPRIFPVAYAIILTTSLIVMVSRFTDYSVF